MLESLVRFMVVVSLVFFLSGCGKSTSDDQGGGGDNGGNAYCASDSECPEGQVCNAGVCENPESQNCSSDADCTGGKKCNMVSGTCVECLSDSDCPTDYSCISNECKSNNAGACDPPCAAGEKCVERLQQCKPENWCSEDSDCPTGQACNMLTNTCEQSGCVADTDCPTGYYCDNGQCKQDPCGGTCSGATPYCNESTGMCVECLGDRHCQAGETCDPSTYTCQTSGGGSCCPGGGCPSGYVCNETTCQCETSGGGGSCQEGAPCQSDADCGGGTCNPLMYTCSCGGGGGNCQPLGDPSMCALLCTMLGGTCDAAGNCCTP